MIIVMIIVMILIVLPIAELVLTPFVVFANSSNSWVDALQKIVIVFSFMI